MFRRSNVFGRFRQNSDLLKYMAKNQSDYSENPYYFGNSKKDYGKIKGSFNSAR